MTYIGAIEYNPDITFTPTDIENMGISYNPDGPKAYIDVHDSLTKKDFKRIKNITGAPSRSAAEEMFDDTEHLIEAYEEGTHYTGYVVYAKEREPT